ncbi:hypothetical protein ABT119_07755 [Streptomyces sp. NPDC001910]|uniref:hypothetical protein n=1 Tax=Streptomyces sp. NPDC001910 TaxID=3154403 RepID=UPI00333462DB
MGSEAISTNGVRLRIEVHDPDTRALPTLVAGVADRWGVQLTPDRKITWCELETNLAPPAGPGILRAEALRSIFGAACLPSESSKLGRTTAEELAIADITDFLHWTSAHGCDVDEVLDRAQMRHDAESDGRSAGRV